MGTWVYPTLGFKQYNKQDTEKAQTHLKKYLTLLNGFLETRTFLVGERVTLADITLACNMMMLYAKYWIQNSESHMKMSTGGLRHVSTNQTSNQLLVHSITNDTRSFIQRKRKIRNQKQSKKNNRNRKKQKMKRHQWYLLLTNHLRKRRIFLQMYRKVTLFWMIGKDFIQIILLRNLTHTCGNTLILMRGWWHCDYNYNHECTIEFMTYNLMQGMFQRLEGCRKHLFGVLLMIKANTDGKDHFAVSGVWLQRGQEQIL